MSLPSSLTKYSGQLSTLETADGKVWEIRIQPDGSVTVIREVVPYQQPQPQQSQQQQQPQPQPQPNQSSGIGVLVQSSNGRGGSGQEPEPDTSGTHNYKNKLDPVFTARLSNIMTDNMFDRNIRARKRGRLDMHNLWRASVGATNVFMKKEARKGKAYNIVLCIDESGSMSGSRIKMAAETAVFLAAHFNKLNLDIAIIGYNSNNKIHKTFNTPYIKDQQFEQLYSDIVKRCTGDTRDPEALKEAFNQLFRKQKQHEKNFVILVSDGGGYEEQCRQIIKANESIAETVGVGIYDECIQIPDPKNRITIRNLDQLKPAILDYLRTKIRRG